MSLDCIRQAADCARLSDCIQDFRTVQLTICVYRWSGERLGVGEKQLISALVMPKYEVRRLSAREAASSGGRFLSGDVRIKDVSPPYLKSDGLTFGGYTRAQLDPQSAFAAPEYQTPVRSTEVEYVLSGETAGIYSLIDVESDDITSWGLVLRLTRKSP